VTGRVSTIPRSSSDQKDFTMKHTITGNGAARTYYRDDSLSSRDHNQRPLTLLLIHGFLDDHTVWDDLIDELRGAFAITRFDLAGSGSRLNESIGPGLLGFAANATSIIDDLDGDVILVGQSMGAQVAELAAIDRPKAVIGLVLVAPVPLGGTHLPEEALGSFKSLGGQAEMQAGARKLVSPALTDEKIEKLTLVGATVSPENVIRYVDIWNDGIEGHDGPSAYKGPTLVIHGGSDGFLQEELVSGTVVPRFTNVDSVVFPEGGHWLHVEFPDQLAVEVSRFVGKVASRS
jgi:pimeloyl-ACP methyl ester carboxylesterase